MDQQWIDFIERMTRIETKLDVLANVKDTADKAQADATRANHRLDDMARRLEELSANTQGIVARAWTLASPVITGIVVWWITTK
ncbi:hemolysin XhlA family protein [Exiguobacterium sp. s22]|uniref:hemolysin XhlA family protein n=1 Tax=Exiguobacterium sp. s22 TaxID=2751272 RepID=UPI001BE717AA|nr:hemolysin XhlA family protein [Exiguobacterium sp. s22]